VDGSVVKGEAFIAQLRPLQRPLEVYCRRMLNNRSLVEDVIQSAVSEAFAHFDQFIAGTNFKAWIFRFVTFEIFNRNRKREPVSFGEVPPESPVEESWELATQDAAMTAMLEDPDVVLEYFDDAVVDALRHLPSKERAVFLLYSAGEFSYKDIHELLSIPLGSVIGYLSRARKRLRVSLAEYAFRHGLYQQGPSTEERAS
jgi:RNA polymerase sigma-70 factor, ECF subfamily